MGFFFLLFQRIPRAVMAVGKNKGLKIGGKKGAKKKIVDPFTRKDWYDIKAPANFKVRDIGKTLVNRTQGTKIASEGLKSRVFEVSLADLQNEEAAERSFRKFKFICDDVQGKNCLCSFYGMSLTSDKLKGVVKKWQSLIECYVDAKTTDGYIVRVGCIGFTDRVKSDQKTCYAQSTQIRKIRAKMTEIISREVSNGTIKELVEKLIPDSIAIDIQKRCRGIYPMQEVHTRKVKVIKRPKLDKAKLMEAHDESGKVTDPKTGETVSRPKFEPKVQESV